MLSQVAEAATTVTGSSPITGFIVPVLVSVFTKNTLDPKLKALLAGLMSIGAALFAADGQVDQAMLESALSNTFMAFAAYKGIWDHLRLNEWMIPGVGIGPKPVESEPGDPDFEFEAS
jgi:hypothetical protein